MTNPTITHFAAAHVAAIFRAGLDDASVAAVRPAHTTHQAKGGRS